MQYLYGPLGKFTQESLDTQVSQLLLDKPSTLSPEQTDFWTRFVSAIETVLSPITNNHEINTPSAAIATIQLLNYSNTKSLIEGEAGLGYFVYAFDGHTKAAHGLESEAQVKYNGFVSPFSAQTEERTPKYGFFNQNPMAQWPAAKIDEQLKELLNCDEPDLSADKLAAWQPFIEALNDGMTPLATEALLNSNDSLREALSFLAKTDLADTVTKSKAVSFLVFSYYGELEEPGSEDMSSSSSSSSTSLPRTPSRGLGTPSATARVRFSGSGKQSSSGFNLSRAHMTSELARQVTEQKKEITELKQLIGRVGVYLEDKRLEDEVNRKAQVEALVAQYQEAKSLIEGIASGLRDHITARSEADAAVAEKVTALSAELATIKTSLAEMVGADESSSSSPPSVSLQGLQSKFSELETQIGQIQTTLAALPSTAKITELETQLGAIQTDLATLPGVAQIAGISQLLADMQGTRKPSSEPSSSSSSQSSSRARSTGRGPQPAPSSGPATLEDISAKLDTIIAFAQSKDGCVVQ